MSLLTIAWSMCAGACAIIGLTQILLWVREPGPGRKFYLLSTTMSVAASATALIELALMKSPDVAHYGQLLQWENFTIFALVVSLVWFIHLRLGSRRTWLAILITLLWCVSLVVNFVFPHSIVFGEIARLDIHATAWGEPYVLAAGELNSWVIIPNVASLLILAYIADAGFHCWREGERRRAVLVAGGSLLFILIGGIQAPMVDAGWLHMPYMVSFAYLAIVFALAYELAESARRAAILANERAAAIGDAREAREELERLGRASLLGEFVTGIAHELNQPLAAILANAQAAKRQLAAPAPDVDELREIVDDVVRDDKRAGDVIHRLRELLQKHTGQRQRVSLAGMVRETVDLVRPELRAHDIRLSLDLGEAAWTVEADRVGLQQVLLNLLSNAIRASRGVPQPDRALRLALSLSEGTLCLSVADRGRGISAEAMPRLFDAFYTSNTGSLGMGLALCKRIVEAHGGRIEARNRNSGGAEFRVTLPKAQANG